MLFFVFFLTCTIFRWKQKKEWRFRNKNKRIIFCISLDLHYLCGHIKNVMTAKTFKRLPYGNSNFESVRTENYAYVDKTRYIELLEQETNKYQFFIRPRKFGKSLFFSMLSNYYDMLRANRFDKLFGELYIGKNPTPRKNSYTVLEFDFSGLDTATPENFIKSFEQNIQWTVNIFLEKYKSVFPRATELMEQIIRNREGIGSLRLAFGAALIADVKIFIIIDEYDHFANDLIAMGVEDVYKKMVQANGVVRDFYETLKIGTKSVVDRIFITGISPVMVDDLTSGFNIAANLTLLEHYNNMMGFTRQEVDWLIDETGVNRDYITVDMELYYNGYLFYPDAADRVYNPSMMLYFFNQIINERKIPKNIIDDNLKTDYGRLRRLTQNETNRAILLQIVKDGGIVTQIQSKFSIDHLYTEKYFVSLLFYMGLLTIEKPDFGYVRLCIPNYSIKTVYWEYIMEEVQISSNFAINNAELKRSIIALARDGQAKPFIDYVVKNIFKKLSNRDLQKFDEKYIKIMLLGCLFQSNVYIPVSEIETDSGYADICLFRSPLMPEVKYEWLFELKYLKASEKSLDAHRLDAQKQLYNYSESPLMKGRKDVKKAVILFIGKNKYELFEA